MTDQPVDHLSRALAATERLVMAVRDDQWSDPTPCTEWNVGELVAHIVSGNYLFAVRLRGEQPDAGQRAPASSADLPQAYRDSASTVVEAFRQPGVLERMVRVPFGTVPGKIALHLRITDVLVHGWDLARATGQAPELPA